MVRPLIVLFVSLSAACGGSPGSHPTSSVLGSWRWPQTSPELTLTTVLGSDSFTMNADCTFGGVAFSASTTSPAVIDDTTIDVTADSHDLETRNGANCEATIKATTFTWSLHGSDTLELTAQGQPPLTLTRVSN
jgi:hypothetical protein